jgi:LacI family transcriptional regulator
MAVPNVTLRDIANETGVSRMAVSLALRGKAGVSEATRQHVLKTAERLGYQPDPEVAKLLARIRARTPADSTACLALLTSGASAGDWKRYATERKYVEGARARAQEYGYRLEEFWVNEPGLTPARLSSIMWNRGIEGVIVAPLQERLSDEKSRSVQLDFDLFSLVEISETIDAPDLDRSIHDQYTAMLKCLEELTRLNYRTIGLVLQYELDLRVNGKWTAAYLRYRQQTGSKSMPPPLILPATRQADFDRWFDRHRPDAIISVDRFGLHFLKARGLRIPRQIGYATLDRDGDATAFPDVSGIDQNSHRVGAAAVDLLVATMHRGQRGIPAHPVRMEVEGTWIAGSSTRRQRASGT